MFNDNIKNNEECVYEYIQNSIPELQILENNHNTELNFTINDIEYILDILNENRCHHYDDWVCVGICLYNINPNYFLLWEKWAQKNGQYEWSCEEKWDLFEQGKWDSFEQEKNVLEIGSLLLWAKNDNLYKYDEFIKNKKINNMILSKYPNDKLILGEKQYLCDNNCYVYLNNKYCLIKGGNHADIPANSMYIEILEKFMIIKCRHAECFGKIYRNHILLDKNDIDIVFGNNIDTPIKNDNKLVDFQQINIYDDIKINKLVYNSLSGKPAQLAEIIYYFYENDYIYAENNKWYAFINHRWMSVGTKNSKLRFLIHPKLKELFKKLYKHYEENNATSMIICSLKQIIDSFGTTALKNNIMRELIDLYTEHKNPDRNFIKKLDSNKHLIGFNNGIYDLNKFEFRKGLPQDYISMTVGYDYQEQHTEKHNDLLKFLSDIQPNAKEREYMLTYLSIGLIGNQLELFTILTGCGNNCKSKLVGLLKCTFGEYFGLIQSQLFIKSHINYLDPGLLNLMTKRIVIGIEPENNAKLNGRIIKFITSRDSIPIQKCHSNNMIDFTPNFITFLVCNDIPECDNMDSTFGKRLRCINFPTEYQTKIDVNCWKLEFILLLIEKYKIYTQTTELKTTQNILKWANKYIPDLYLQFLNECTEENTNGSIHCSTLYNAFIIWFKLNIPNTQTPNNREFVANIRRYKKVKKMVINHKVLLGIPNLKLLVNDN
jgi:phage/plasmid-associated DNA primase